MHLFRSLITFVALSCSFFSTLSAQSNTIENGRFSFNFDNDVFFQSDEYFTNGIIFGVTSQRYGSFRDSVLPDGPGACLDKWPMFQGGDAAHSLSVSFAHRIYTPADIKNPDPNTDDLPYSAVGLLYFSATRQEINRLDVVSFAVGMVGPAMHGEEAQNNMHGILSSDEARGWDHQIDNEVLLNAFYMRNDTALWKQFQ